MAQTTTDTQPSVSLVVPCRAEYVALCRLVAGSLGLQEALDEETIADIKVVVTEAFNYFLAGEEPEGPALGEAPCLQLDLTASPDEWVIIMSNPDHRLRIPRGIFKDPMSESSLGLTIIEALVDSMEHTDDDIQGSVFRLVKRISSFPGE